jgi:putative endonuclease
VWVEGGSVSDFGSYGESIARDYLEAQGFLILDANYRFHHAEVDIIAEIDDLLVFCEVKARRDGAFGAPEQAITALKARQIRRVAMAYLAKEGISERQCRFDFIGILVSHGVIRLNHIRDAFW